MTDFDWKDWPQRADQLYAGTKKPARHNGFQLEPMGPKPGNGGLYLWLRNHHPEKLARLIEMLERLEASEPE